MEKVEKQLYQAIDQLLEKAKVVVIVSKEVSFQWTFINL